MSIFGNNKKAYMINKTDAGVYKLCKILNEYDTQKGVNEALSDLLTDKKTEKQLLKEYSKKSIL